MKLNPAPTNASRMAKEAGSSAVQPKTLPPRQTGETSRGDPPSLRVFIHCSLRKIQRKGIDTSVDAARKSACATSPLFGFAFSARAAVVLFADIFVQPS